MNQIIGESLIDASLSATPGNTDYWSDPKGEFLAAAAAGKVYTLLGKEGAEPIEHRHPRTSAAILRRGHLSAQLRQCGRRESQMPRELAEKLQVLPGQ